VDPVVFRSEGARQHHMSRNVYSGLLETRRPVNGAPDRDMVTLTVARTVPAGALSGVFVLLVPHRLR
jgi:hypothetical protein